MPDPANDDDAPICDRCHDTGRLASFGPPWAPYAWEDHGPCDCKEKIASALKRLTLLKTEIVHGPNGNCGPTHAHRGRDCGW